MILVTAASTISAFAQQNMTNQQKTAMVLKILKSGTPQQKVVACNAVSQVIHNYTATPVHQNFVDKMAVFIWASIYHVRCDNVTGVLKING